MASATPFVPQNFEIGRVFGMTFGLIGRNAPLYFGIAFLVSGLPQMLLKYFVLQSVAVSTVTTNANGAVASFYSQYSNIGIVWFAGMLLGVVAQAALIRVAIEDLNGRRPAIGDVIAVVVSVIPVAISVSIVTGLGIIVGMILLVVPGIILCLSWCMVIPVLVQERTGLFETISRSGDLTKGSRWRLFGLFVVIVIAMWVLQAVLALVSTTMLFGAGFPIANAVAAAISSTVSTVLLTAAVAASYVELRLVREGTGIDELADIFA